CSGRARVPRATGRYRKAPPPDSLLRSPRRIQHIQYLLGSSRARRQRRKILRARITAARRPPQAWRSRHRQPERKAVHVRRCNTPGDRSERRARRQKRLRTRTRDSPAQFPRWPHVAIHRPDARVEGQRSEEHTSELQSLAYLVCRLLLEKKMLYQRQSDRNDHPDQRDEPL